MAQENVEAVRRVYDSWAEGDFTAGEDLFDPQGVLVLGPDFPDAGTYTGREGIRGYMRGFLEPWTRLTIAAEELEDRGDDAVLAAVRQIGVGESSGLEIELRFFHVWIFRDGKVMRLEVIRDRAQALAAAGPRGPEEENVEAFLRVLEAFHRGDFDAWIEAFAEDVEFIPQRAPFEDPYRGRARLRDFLADNAENFDLFHPTYDYVRGVGDRVIALGKLRLRGKGGGVEIEVPTAVVVTYRDGKVVRFEDVADRKRALDAVGLSEQDASAPGSPSRA